MPDAVTTEKPAKSRRKRILRLLIVGLLALVVLLYCGMISLYVYWAVQPANHAVCCVTPLDWGVERYDDVVITTGDGIDIAAWYIPPQPDAPAPRDSSVIILLHGYGSDRLGLGEHAVFLNDAGYGVLMVDLRGHGESAEVYRSEGWEDVRDIPALVAFVQSHADVRHIGILGHSVGGHIALRAAADLPEIEAVVADGTPSATARDYTTLLDDHPLFWFWYLTYSIAEQAMALGLDIDTPEAVIDALPRLRNRPVLLIAGGAERPEPDFAREFHARLGDDAELWVIRDAGHGGTWRTAHEAYVQRVVGFFDAAFAAP